MFYWQSWRCDHDDIKSWEPLTRSRKILLLSKGQEIIGKGQLNLLFLLVGLDENILHITLKWITTLINERHLTAREDCRRTTKDDGECPTWWNDHPIH